MLPWRPSKWPRIATRILIRGWRLLEEEKERKSAAAALESVEK